MARSSKYRDSNKSSCAMCKPWKRGHAPKFKLKEQDKIRRAEEESKNRE